MDLIAKAFVAANRRIQRVSRRRSRRWLEAYEPRLFECWHEFQRISGQQFPFHPERARLILTMLERYRPKTILELGAGTSTAWFAAYAQRHGASLISVDQHKEWLEGAVQSARMVGPVEGVLASVEIEPDLGARYALDLPDAEFIYIDGPWFTMRTGMMNGKGVHLDVPQLLRHGRRPAVIMLDSKLDTVEYLRGQGLTKDYIALPEFKYCLRKRDWAGALHFRRQSIFIRRGQGD